MIAKQTKKILYFQNPFFIFKVIKIKPISIFYKKNLVEYFKIKKNYKIVT